MQVNKMFRLDGKIALVTGGGRGIGKFIATGLAEAGADLIITSRKLKNLEDTAKELEASCGVTVLPLACDVANPDDIETMFRAAVEKFQRIDVLFNNSGVTWGAPTLEYPLEKWEHLFNVNVRGVWILTQKVANLMKVNGGGNIINISSMAAFRGFDENVLPSIPYGSSKGAINLLTIDLAVKLAKYNIRVNAIAPGYFRTDIVSHYEDPGMKPIYDQLLQGIPLNRIADTDDMKGVAVFLASDASAYMTGHVLRVDGGFTVK